MKCPNCKGTGDVLTEADCLLGSVQADFRPRTIAVPVEDLKMLLDLAWDSDLVTAKEMIELQERTRKLVEGCDE